MTRSPFRLFLIATITAALTVIGASGPALSQELFVTIRTSALDIRFMRGVQEEDARHASEYLQAEYDSITHQLQVAPKKRIEVRIYDNVGRYLAESGLKKPWRGAYYVKGVLHCQPVQALIQREIFDQSLTSEIARGILQSAGEQGCPLWLRESYAAYRTGSFRKMSAPVGAKLTAFSDLNQDIQAYPDPPQRDDVQYMLGQTMNFFILAYGETKAFSLFADFDGTRGAESVFRRVLGQEYGIVEKAWASHIATHTAPFKR
jgi:hypothetical protein